MVICSMDFLYLAFIKSAQVVQVYNWKINEGVSSTEMLKRNLAAGYFFPKNKHTNK